MKIRLSEHFTYKKLLSFVVPSIVMMIFTSIYGVVDGLFVSNFAGEKAFAAINLIMPVLMIFGGIGFMIGTGGSALVAKTLGEGDEERANRIFSMLIITTVISGVTLSVIGMFVLRPVAILLRAEGQTLEYCVSYGSIIIPAITAFMLQNVFQSLLITAEKPRLGLAVTIAAGVTNMVLDGVFVGVFKWGVEGAAAATAISQVVGGIVPLIYFLSPKNGSRLHLCKTRLELRTLAKVCANGSSEMMTNISMSLVNMLYNFQLMKYAGEAGISAYGVIMYVNFIFVSVFIGYSIGTAPIISYHYGAKNVTELKSIFKKSMIIIGTAGIFLTTASVLLSHPLSALFVSYNKELMDMTTHAMIIYSFAFLLAGFNIYGSSLFTALNNGPVSALISFLRTLLFQAAAILIMPLLFELEGIWFSIIVAEVGSLIVTLAFIIKYRKRYQYC